MVLRSRSSLAFSTRYPSREQLHQSRPRPIRAPCCCPTCVVGAFIGPPAPTPRPAIKHGTHVVKRNRNRYCYRSHDRYGTLEQFARRRDTIHLVPYALFRGPIFHAARPRGACNADRFSSRSIEKSNGAASSYEMLYVAQMLSRRKEKRIRNYVERFSYLNEAREKEEKSSNRGRDRGTRN